EVEKNLIGKNCEMLRRTNRVQTEGFVGFGKVSGGIVGMHHDDGTSARCNRLLQSVKVDVPAVIVKKWVAQEFDVLYLSKEVKQGMDAPRTQHFSASVAQQEEE